MLRFLLRMIVSLVCYSALMLSVFSVHVLAQTIDVLIIGGGASGVSAGITSARLQQRTMMIEESPWLGGMLTSAGVSATDGNHRLPSGLWAEFRERLRRYYGGADKLFTGWVSNTQFEPHVGARILDSMCKAENKLTVLHGYFPIAVQKNRNRITGVTVQNAQGQKKTYSARVIIDATELGDVAAMAGVRYDIGMEARAITGESGAPATANTIIQDLTFAATLKDYGLGADRTIPRPPHYTPSEFDCTCKESCADSTKKVVDCQKMLEYGKLPVTNGGAKYMINWPTRGNDHYTNVIERTREERFRAFDSAKQTTRRFIYHLQHTLGMKHLGLAHDEFPTSDSMALIPYHRESRRIHGIVRFTVNHIINPYQTTLYKTGIAVGDYPVDHHHDKYYRMVPSAPHIQFPSIPSFTIPLGTLIPKGIDGLIVAEKSISVSNIVNGTTRLQPCVLLIGQAAGTLAALSARERTQPRSIGIRAVQNSLIQQKAYILPFLDVPPDSPFFEAVQKIGASGVLKGRGVPHAWANQTWFDADSVATIHLMRDAFAHAHSSDTTSVQTSQINTPNFPATRIHALEELARYAQFIIPERGKKAEAFLRSNLSALLTRKELAQILHDAFQPFDHAINHQGNTLTIRPKQQKEKSSK